MRLSPWLDNFYKKTYHQIQSTHSSYFPQYTTVPEKEKGNLWYREFSSITRTVSFNCLFICISTRGVLLWTNFYRFFKTMSRNEVEKLLKNVSCPRFQGRHFVEAVREWWFHFLRAQYGWCRYGRCDKNNFSSKFHAFSQSTNPGEYKKGSPCFNACIAVVKRE